MSMQREWTAADQSDFDAALNDFFDICFEKQKAGEMSLGQIERFIKTVERHQTKPTGGDDGR